MGAHFEALNEPVLKAPSDSRYTQVAFNRTEISPSGNNSGFLVLSLYPKKFRPILRDFDFTSGFPNIKGFKIHFNHFSKLT